MEEGRFVDGSPVRTDKKDGGQLCEEGCRGSGAGKICQLSLR
jgi:hypothetical protein